jgi:short-subunit dehydrogenase
MVTGGRCGIGATIAIELASEGMSLCSAACDSGKLRDVAESRKNTATTVMPLTPADLPDPDAAGKAFAKCLRTDPQA